MPAAIHAKQSETINANLQVATDDVVVITADLVQSRKLTDAQFNDILQRLTQWLAALPPPQRLSTEGPRAEIFRGDSFQLLCSSPTAFRCVVDLRLKLLSQGVDARFAVVRGPIEQLSRSLAQSRGTALTQSGHLLDGMTGRHWQWRDLLQPLTASELLLLHSCSVLISKLTERQAEVLQLYLAFERPEHQQLAAMLGTSRVNITNLLNQAQYDLIGSIVDYFNCRNTPT